MTDIMPTTQMQTFVGSTFFLRLGIGGAQGLLLYGLYAWTDRVGAHAIGAQLLFPTLALLLLLPSIAVVSVGHMARKQFWIWLTIAASLIASLAWYDVWHRLPFDQMADANMTESLRSVSDLQCLWVMMLSLFVAQSLVTAGCIDKRFLASYETCFDISWTLMIQAAFSFCFVGLLWLVLFMGGKLFDMLHVDLFDLILLKTWFLIPVTAIAWTMALHVTDTRPGIVRGIRSLLLGLLAWLLPIAVLVMGSFLVALAVNGLDLLWSTGHATALLLTASIILIALINTSYQSGAQENAPPRILQWSARIASVLLLILCTLAILAMHLRVDQYGWTTSRVTAAVYLLLASLYALAYVWSALQLKNWMADVARVNVMLALFGLACVVALLSPIADPERMAAQNQLTRFAEDKVSINHLDLVSLRFDNGRFGIEALRQLANWSHGGDAAEVRARAGKILALHNRWEVSQLSEAPIKPILVANNLQVWPKGAHIPNAFLEHDWTKHRDAFKYPKCLLSASKCDAVLLDLNDNGEQQLLLIEQDSMARVMIFTQTPGGDWELAGQLNLEYGTRQEAIEALRNRTFKTLKPRLPDLEVGGRRLQFYPEL